MMPYTKIKKQGFSLVETLVAISILLLVVTGPTNISMRSAKSTSFAAEQVQAFFLAQEGLELAQKGRDDFMLLNSLASTSPSYVSDPWGQFTKNTGTGLYQRCLLSSGCGMQWDSANAGEIEPVRDCSVASNCLLYLTDTGRSRFTHTSTGNVATPFTRRIYFEKVDVAGKTVAIKVNSVVTWRTGSLVAEQSVSIMTCLYNIYDLP